MEGSILALTMQKISEIMSYTFTFSGISFDLYDVFYCTCIFSIISVFIVKVCMFYIDIYD